MTGLSGGEPLASREVNARARRRMPECAAQGAGQHESTSVCLSRFQLQFLGLLNHSADD